MLSDLRLATLRTSIAGSVHGHADPIYATARLGWNRAYDQRPALVVLPETTRDVITAVGFARAEGLPIAVQATGHGASSDIAGAMLIDTSRLDRILVDPQGRTARFGGGARISAVVAAAQSFGLTPLNGFARTVGATGFTLGGGLGWLARRHGYAADHVRSIEIVTAEGELRRVDASSHPDLFWALRGMGRDFGVVVSVEVALHPVTMVHGGTMFFPIDAMSTALRVFGDFTRSAPEDITSMLALYRFPDLDMLPPFLRGQALVGFHAAAVDKGLASRFDAMRKIATPIIDTFADMPFGDVGSIANDPVDPMPGHVRGFAIADWSAGLEDALMALAGPDQQGHFVKVELRHLGGAVAREPVGGTAIGQREGQFLACYVAPTPAPGMMETAKVEATRFDAALAPFKAVGPCANFVHSGDEFEGAFPPARRDRLKSIKRQYDPANVFRFPGYLSDEARHEARRSGVA